MSDPVTLARTARESLAKGLNALQAEPGLPPQVVELAAPIAEAMGALHQIERSQGAQLMPHSETALSKVRASLAQLQTQANPVGAVLAAMEAVAASLGQVNQLQQMASGPKGGTVPPANAAPVAAAPAASAPAPAAPVAAAPAPAPAPAAPAAAPAPVAAPVAAAPAPAPAPAPVAAAPAPNPTATVRIDQPAVVAAAAAAAPVPAPAPAAAAPPPQAVPAQDPFAARPAGGPAAAPAPGVAGGAQQRASIPVPSPPHDGRSPAIEAALGAHSPTNFYKGLSGNDIIDHGGLFVATYMIPKIGSAVRLRVSMPGGYEFEANALVQWAREADPFGDSQPGFGAKFTEISQEARQLVYRYVRNREPLFHDDL